MTSPTPPHPHVLIWGGAPDARRARLRAYVQTLECATSKTLLLPPNLDSMDAYLEAIRVAFPIRSPMGTPREVMNRDQLWDMHLDWALVAPPAHRTPVVWPEFTFTGETGKQDLGAILGDYVRTQADLVDASEQPKRAFILLATTPLDPSMAMP